MPSPILSYNPPYGLPPIPPPVGARVRWEYHPEIVALLTVDGEPSLEQLRTANYFLVGSRVELNITVDGAEEAQDWVLHTGDVSGESDVVPDDYNDATNHVHWLKVS